MNDVVRYFPKMQKRNRYHRGRYDTSPLCTFLRSTLGPLLRQIKGHVALYIRTESITPGCGTLAVYPDVCFLPPSKADRTGNREGSSSSIIVSSVESGAQCSQHHECNLMSNRAQCTLPQSGKVNLRCEQVALCLRRKKESALLLPSPSGIPLRLWRCCKMAR